MCRFELIEVRDAKRKGSDVARWRAQEADHLRQALSGVSTWVALDERGEEWGSERLARELQERQTRSHSSLAFVIGGPDGFDPSLLKSAPKTLRLGKMTLPHELARLVLLEQLYRAHSILANTPYHRP